MTDEVPAGLSRPTGGLFGNAGYINVNEGTDFSIDAIALPRWSDKGAMERAGQRRIPICRRQSGGQPRPR
ncbi:MAG: hypothetical protein IPM02_04430 [Betaproteobacteria bacterium]|nr:hypothetical protein [Betaproteobacteria bacterium]